ncbi:MAG: DUF5908 family protein [Saprospiraceae bacterium]|nr:DUF5908 family protein [Saprospiraceae bacterium]
MPIEIKELHIKATINQVGGQQTAGSTGSASGQPASPADTDKLVAECVEKVLEILKQRNER